MTQKIVNIALVVKDYDEAIAFYTQKLGFVLIEDVSLDEDKRWVVVKPPGENETGLILAKAASPEQQLSIGNQTGAGFSYFLIQMIFGGITIK